MAEHAAVRIRAARAEEFDRIGDGFRDSRVWRKVNGEWQKDNLWGEGTPRSLGQRPR